MNIILTILAGLLLIWILFKVVKAVAMLPVIIFILIALASAIAYNYITG